MIYHVTFYLCLLCYMLYMFILYMLSYVNVIYFFGFWFWFKFIVVLLVVLRMGMMLMVIQCSHSWWWVLPTGNIWWLSYESIVIFSSTSGKRWFQHLKYCISWNALKGEHLKEGYLIHSHGRVSSTLIAIHCKCHWFHTPTEISFGWPYIDEAKMEYANVHWILFKVNIPH